MECNSEYSHCYPFSHVIYSLNPHISLGSNDRPCSESLYKLNISYFFMYTLCQTPGTDGKWSVAIQTVYLLSGSPETTIQSGLITVDSESLHTYCIVTFVLRWTDHFPLCNGSFITFEEPFLVPHELCSHSLGRQNRRTTENSESAVRVHVTHNLTAFAFILACRP